MANTVSNENLIEVLGQIINASKEEATKAEKATKEFSITYFRNKNKEGKEYNSTKGKYIHGVEGLDDETSYFVNFSKKDTEPTEMGKHSLKCKHIYVKKNSVLIFGIEE